jgi:hypothetical protein
MQLSLEFEPTSVNLEKVGIAWRVSRNVKDIRRVEEGRPDLSLGIDAVWAA